MCASRSPIERDPKGGEEGGQFFSAKLKVHQSVKGEGVHFLNARVQKGVSLCALSLSRFVRSKG